VSDIAETIERLNQLPTVMAGEIRRAMNSSLILIEADARRLAPRDVGRLAGSITSHVEGSGTNLTGTVGPSTNYAATMEFGRRIGATRPPVQALVPWVQRHWVIPLVDQQQVLPEFFGEVRSTNKRYAGRSVRDAQLRRRAFALAISISRRGIRQRAYLRQAYGNNRGQISVLFRRIGTQVAASISGRTSGGASL